MQIIYTIAILSEMGYNLPIHTERSTSNMKKAIAQILLDEGYIKSFQVIDDGKKL